MENQKNLYISSSLAKNLPSMVKNELAKMPAEKQEEFVEEYKRKAKSTGTAYLLLILGLHYPYVRKWGLFVVFYLTFMGFLIWWFIDIFRNSKIISDYNRDVAMDTMCDLKVLSN